MDWSTAGSAGRKKSQLQRKKKWAWVSLIGWMESAVRVGGSKWEELGPEGVVEGTGVEWRMRKVVR